MEKKAVIEKIKSVILDYGSFSLYEVDGAEGVSVNSMGNLVAVAEEFNANTIGVNVYDTSSSNSNEIDFYEMNYDELSESTLEDILFIVELYEADQSKTIKRCSN